MAAIELRGVVKRFGSITAVDGLDLEVPEGICLGLLGPNGAGKSTTMRLLTGQAIPDAGRLRVLGYELPRESKSARAVMGVVPQLDNLDIDVTVEDNLAVFARLYRVEDVGAAVDAALDEARGPWPRLEAACVAHLESLLADQAHAAVMTADLSRLDSRLKRRLVTLRDGYEKRFVELVAALPLPA
ncbi:MAG TPA: ATP-binding cassette domain-containing protein, partial [Solirubrobacterales bacterium]